MTELTCLGDRVMCSTGDHVSDFAIFVWSDGVIQIQPEGNLPHCTTIADLREHIDWAARLLTEHRARLERPAQPAALDGLKHGSVVIDGDGDSWEMNEHQRWVSQDAIDPLSGLPGMTSSELVEFVGYVRVVVPVNHHQATRREPVTMYKFINLTPHTVQLVKEDGTVAAEYASQGEARVTETLTGTTRIGGVPVSTVRYGEPKGLPEPVPGTYLIVSRVTAQAAAGRHDLLFPAREVRDAVGRIVGCRALGRFAQ